MLHADRKWVTLSSAKCSPFCDKSRFTNGRVHEGASPGQRSDVTRHHRLSGCSFPALPFATKTSPAYLPTVQIMKLIQEGHRSRPCSGPTRLHRDRLGGQYLLRSARAFPVAGDRLLSCRLLHYPPHGTRGVQQGLPQKIRQRSQLDLGDSVTVSILWRLALNHLSMLVCSQLSALLSSSTSRPIITQPEPAGHDLRASPSHA